MRQGVARPADPAAARAVGLPSWALLRDTCRGLAGPALYNHFPASLVTVTWVFHGALHLVEGGRIRPGALPAVSVAGPQPAPVTSWSPGAVLALTQAFKPEAWRPLRVGAGRGLSGDAAAHRRPLRRGRSGSRSGRSWGRRTSPGSKPRCGRFGRNGAPDAWQGGAVGTGLGDWVRATSCGRPPAALGGPCARRNGG
ncbi:MAG: hypothetical protein R3D59_17615 [Paracoccaceae bacterium]